MAVTKTREQNVRQILLLALGLNIFVALLKLGYGLLTHTLSMTSDGLHSFTDAGSSIMGLIAIFYASKPSDDNHHYGHQKYETLAALGIGLFIILTSWEIIKHAIARFFSTQAPSFHPIGIAIILFTIVINIFLSWIERKKGEEYKSAILRADAAHTSSDIFVSISVLLSLIVIHFGFPKIDAIISLLLVVYFGFVAYSLLKENIFVLSDAAFIDPKKVQETVTAIPGVLSCHRVRTRGKPGEAFVDLHIEINAKTDITTSHDLVHRVESELKEKLEGIRDVMIHTEPFPNSD